MAGTAGNKDEEEDVELGSVFSNVIPKTKPKAKPTSKSQAKKPPSTWAPTSASHQDDDDPVEGDEHN